jgi:hypothetical protein
MIDILVPVLGRPQNVQPLIEAFKVTTAAYEIHFLCSPGDDAQIVACRVSGADTIVVNAADGQHQYPIKMNDGFAATKRPFLLLASDDISPEPGWDTEALRVAEETDAGVIGTNDMANGYVKAGIFSTHSLVRRRYVTEWGGSLDGPGTLIHEGYDHNFSDRELCGLAQARGEWAFAKRSILRHRHPLWKTASWDATYRKGLSTFHEDQRLFLERAAEWGYAGLHADEVKVAKR